MTALEWRAVSSLASIYALRMMGLFMILPVFALYAQGLDHVTPTLVGMAIGAYGLTQAVLSIPYGMLSDRFGRKRIISIGLVIFAVGSVVAALSDSIYGVIFGRAVQGAGAIAAVVMALTSDLTREEHRLRAMAVIGMSIGVSFALSMVLGPVLNHWIGVRGIFWLTAVLAILGIIVMYTWVPEVVDSRFHRDTQAMPALFKTVLQDGQLLRLDAGIMFLHIILTATFVVIPLALRDHGGLPAAHHWYVYLPVMLAGFVLMAPFIILAEGKRRMKQVFVGAIIILALSELALALSYRHLMGAAIFLSTMFAAFNLLEACLPSLVAKTVSADRKGTAMGVYSSAQFLGAFIGGVAGGWLHGKYGIGGVFSFCAGVGLLWFLIAYTMRSPRYLSSYLVKVGPVDEQQAQALVVQLTGVRGVAEALVIPEDGIAYLKVDLHALDKEALLRFSVEHE
ncbi:MAG: MFS transporter [Gammaproteobacteria bacterium RBG_16_57_12]|nr:MAG: MFS transporter [Gammaproteobacteria bacterium RBG_16_57_12]